MTGSHTFASGFCQLPDRASGFASSSAPMYPQYAPFKAGASAWQPDSFQKKPADGFLHLSSLHRRTLKRSSSGSRPKQGAIRKRVSAAGPRSAPGFVPPRSSIGRRRRNRGAGRKQSLNAVPSPGPCPGAPYNTNAFLLAGGWPSSTFTFSPSDSAAPFHAVTPNPAAPGTSWRNSWGALDADAAQLGALAGLNMFGTNAGLIARTQQHDPAGALDPDEDEYALLDSSSGDASDSEDDAAMGYSLHDVRPFSSGGGSPSASPSRPEEPTSGDGGAAGQRQRSAEQCAYVSELEERNLDLQQRVHQLREALAQATARAAGCSGAGAAAASCGCGHRG